MIATQLALALDDRHAGQAANLTAGTKTHRDDTARVTAALNALIHSGQPFNASDVHKLVEADDLGPYDRNLVSSQMGTLAHKNEIVRCWGMPLEAATQRARRGSRNPYWQAASRGPAQAA
jgi:hypothetical protein